MAAAPTAWHTARVSEPIDKTKTFELILVHPHARKAVRLPTLSLPPDAAYEARPLLAGVRARFGLDAIVLLRLGGGLGSDRRFTWYRIALAAASEALPAGLAWTLDAELAAVLDELEQVAPDQPWARPAFWPALGRWIGDACHAAGLGPVAAVEQVRAWDLSTVALVRLESGATLYYKAVPRAFAAEPVVTAWLGTLAPARVPELVARDPAHRGMLLHACEGTRLDATEGLTAWERAARDYAEIQRASAPHADQLVRLGLPRRSLAALPDAWERLRADAACLQPGLHTDLTADEQAALARVDGARVAGWIVRLGAHAPLEALEHGDFHAGNAFIGPGGARVIDWTDAAVTHPFLSLATLQRSLEHHPALAAEDGARDRLARAYLAGWGAVDAPLPAIALLGAAYQAVHYRERVAPLAHHFEEIRAAVPAYVRAVLEAADR